MRSLALVFLCFCLAVSGTAAAVPMTGMAMEAPVAAASMDQDCPDMASMPSSDDGTAPVHATKPDCCQVGCCQCATAHFAFVTLAIAPLRSVAITTTVAAIGDGIYSSPALARLVRPPIS